MPRATPVRPQPTCPRCRQEVGAFPGCPGCGLTLGVLDAVYGTAEVVAARVIRGLAEALHRSLPAAPVAAVGDGGVSPGPLAGLRRLRGGGRRGGKAAPNPASPHE